MPYWTLDFEPWHKRAAIIVADFLRTALKPKREVKALRTSDGGMGTLVRFSADTRRELDRATAEWFDLYRYHDAGLQWRPVFKRGEWTCTMRRFNHCD